MAQSGRDSNTREEPLFGTTELTASTPTAPEVLDRVFLEVRCKLLDTAACLDRIERTEGADLALRDRRMKQIHEAIAILSSAGVDRAERIQMLFSDEYVPNWIQGIQTGAPCVTLSGKAFQETT